MFAISLTSYNPVTIVSLIFFRYQLIKFRNNSQITETIPRALFHKANTARKTLYVKCNQLPKLNGRPVFLAINPLSSTQRPVQQQQHQQQRQHQQHHPRQPQRPPHPDDQVSILVKLQRSSSNNKPVLLNVPRKVALKVKVGTTLSFSASNDQKYVVMDNKIHPPVGTSSSASRPAPAQKYQQQPPRPRPRPTSAVSNVSRLPLPPSLSVIKTSHSQNNSNRGFVNFSANRKSSGVTVTRTVARPPTNKVARPSRPAGMNVLASGEV